MKTSGILWYRRDESHDAAIGNSKSFIPKMRITGKNPTVGNTKDVEIAIPLKYLSNFWRTLEIPLINWEINLILKWDSD